MFAAAVLDVLVFCSYKTKLKTSRILLFEFKNYTLLCTWKIRASSDIVKNAKTLRVFRSTRYATRVQQRGLR